MRGCSGPTVLLYGSSKDQLLLTDGQAGVLLAGSVTRLTEGKQGTGPRVHPESSARSKRRWSHR